MFGKKDNKNNERIIYQAKANVVFGCKKVIYGIILLFVLLFLTGIIIKFIGEMQVYMISFVQLPLTRYVTIAMFVAMIAISIYIVWQAISWHSKEYILTESKIIIKSGVLVTHKNYMPFATIQDVSTSQSFLARMFNVGSISVYNAYDNNQIFIEDINNPSEVEDIIFNKITGSRSQPQRLNMNNQYYDDVITPEHAETNQGYTYYPNETYPQNNYNNYDDFDTRQSDLYEDFPAGEENEVNEESSSTQEDSSENVVRRHFDKFKN